MARLVPRDRLIGMVVAPIVWLVYFVLVYSLAGIGCTVGLDQLALGPIGALRALLLGVTLLGILVILYATWQTLQHWRLAREGHPDLDEATENRLGFIALAGLFLCGISLLGTLWGGLTIVVVPPC